MMVSLASNLGTYKIQQCFLCQYQKNVSKLWLKKIFRKTARPKILISIGDHQVLAMILRAVCPNNIPFFVEKLK